MKVNNKVASLVLAGGLILNSVTYNYAGGIETDLVDSKGVVTLGSSLDIAQKDKMLKYFGVTDEFATVLEVTNADIREHLDGIATEAQLGTKAYSCAYIEPTGEGNGINVKTANLTWVTSNMISSTLTTTGITDANVVVASLFPVSGTSGLTGIIMAYEDATGEQLDEGKKEIANEELIITGDLGENVGQDKATGIINDIKTEIIKNGTSDTVQIAETITNVTNNYNITLNVGQTEQIQGLMEKIAKQDYDYEAMKNTLETVMGNVDKNLEAMGETIEREKATFFEGIKDFFDGLFGGNKEEEKEDKDMGILEGTNDDLLGEGAKIDATDDSVLDNIEAVQDEARNIFQKIGDWFSDLFDKLLGGSESVEPKDENVVEGEEENNLDESKEDVEESVDGGVEEPNSGETNVDADGNPIGAEVDKTDGVEDVPTEDVSTDFEGDSADNGSNDGEDVDKPVTE